MKLNKTLTALAVGASFGLSGQALANQSKAGTDITNSASLSYTVGQSTETNTETNDSTFRVDEKIDFLLTPIKADSKVYPGLSADDEDRYYTFKVTNEGNSDQIFKVEDTVAKYAIDGSNGSSGIQDFQLGNVKVYLDTDSDPSNGVGTEGNEFTLKSENLTDAFVAGSNEQFIHVEADQVPVISLANYNDKNNDLAITYTGDLASAFSYTELMVYPIDALGGNRITGDDSENPFDALTQQTVFADTSTDGFGVEILDAVFELETASVKLSKTGTVLDSNIAGYSATGTHHFLPGSTVEYTLTATNEGNMDAKSIVVTDDLTSTEISSKAVFDYSTITLQDPLPAGITTGTGHDTSAGMIVLNFADLTESSGATPSRTVTFTVNVK